MTKLIAAFLCAVLIWGLFRLDRGSKNRWSTALWVPFMWLFIAASRNVTTWLGVSGGGSSDYTEGSPLDRAVLTGILVLGVVVLIMRGPRIVGLLRSNAPILLYFFYCGVSVLWSDFPDVAFKRWFRACGDVVMVLIVLSEPDWLDALKRLLARLGFVLVPLSVLFIRYYPQLGRVYSRGGRPTWVGVATDKNALGMICLIFGLASIFRFLSLFRGEEGTAKTRPLIAQTVLVVMTMYLLREADSATALACCGMAGSVMVLTSLYRWARRPTVLHLMVWGILSVVVSALFLGVGTGMVQDLGRDTTFTGRTAIWSSALKLVQNPLLGTGFESFWIGSRLHQVMRDIDQGVNQAHNGYLEVYLNLGWVGLALLAGLIVTGYRRIIPAVRRQKQGGGLRLAYFMVAIAYNFSEGGFKMMHPVWIVFLLSIAVVPKTSFPNRPKISQQIDGDQCLTLSTVEPQNPGESERTAPDFAAPLTRFGGG